MNTTDEFYEMFKKWSKNTEYLRNPDIIKKRIYNKTKVLEHYYKKDRYKRMQKRFLNIYYSKS